MANLILPASSSLLKDKNSLPNPRILALCDVCRLNAWKFSCPGCAIKSCSLSCVNSHKASTSCSGKRSRSEFLPLSKFQDDLLVSDYDSLEATKRAAESAYSLSGNINGFRGYIGFKLPRNILLLRNAANKRGTKLLLLPPAMSKRKMNQSRYDRKRNSIFWTIEWKFHGTDVVIVDHNVDENLSLIYVIKKHHMPTQFSNQLTPFHNVKATDLKFFIRKTPKGLDSPFRELDITAPISKQLSDVVILEYPVIFVCLPSHILDFEVENGTKSAYKKQATVSTSNLTPSPKAIILPKEEVEESMFSTDQSALLQVNTPLLLDNNTHISNEVGECSKPNSENSVNEERPFGDVNFDFLHELSDVYSELLGGMNPDEFLRLNDSYDELNTLENIFPGDELEKEKF